MTLLHYYTFKILHCNSQAEKHGNLIRPSTELKQIKARDLEPAVANTIKIEPPLPSQQSPKHH